MFRYVALLLLVAAPALAGPTTWGAIKAQYHNDPPHSRLAPTTTPDVAATDLRQKQPRKIYCPECQESGGGFQLHEYNGGMYSLPFGQYVTTTEVLQSAYGMEAFRVAESDWLARGFIRHPEQDRGCVDAMGASAYLAFEKPGTDVRQRQPVLIVRTGPLGDGDYMTQVLGGMLKRVDSTHLTFDGNAADPADPAIAMYGYVEGTNAVSGLPVVFTQGVPYCNGCPTWGTVSEGMGRALGAIGGNPADVKYMTGHTPCYWGYLGGQIGVAAMATIAGPDLPLAIGIGSIGVAMNNHISEYNLMGPGTECP